MTATLAILCALIWIPLLIHLITQRGFLVLIIWLFIAPIATNVINRPGSNPFFIPPVVQETRSVQARQVNTYFVNPDVIVLRDLFEPTRTLLGACFVVLLLTALLKRKSLAPLDRTETWMGVFSLLLIASVFLQSHRLAYGLHIAGDAFIVPFLSYYVARRLVTHEVHFSQLTRAIGYMGLYLIVIGLIERLAHPGLFYRLMGPFGSTNVLYVVLMVVFFMVLRDSFHSVALPQEKQVLPRSVRWFVLYLSPVIICLNWTRGDWLGFFLGVGIYLLLGHKFINPSRKLAAVGLMLMIIPVLAVGVQELIPKEIVEERVAEQSNIYGRLATWDLALQEGIKQPIFGIGLNNLRSVLGTTTRRFQKIASFDTVHNSFLALFAENGAIGLLVYLVLVASIVRMGLTLYRTAPHAQERLLGVVVIAIMIAYLVPAFFSQTLHITNLSHVYVYVCMGAIAGLHGQRHAISAPYITPWIPSVDKPSQTGFGVR